MKLDLWALYGLMLRSRLFEQAVSRLWEEGKISGEMHLGIGEEAIAAGIVSQLREGDAMALDHRGTPPLLMRGVDPVLLLREFLGHPDGLCSGMGGHMHLFSPSHLAASSGIVGASGPSAVGFGLAAQRLRAETAAVAFFGDGAVNQGMLLESMNLAAVWRLPVLFVCKDNAWALTTRSSLVTAGKLIDRARGFGLHAVEIDGSDVKAVWEVAGEALDRARAGDGPTFLRARCVHFEGHFVGDPLLQAARHPLAGMKPMVRTLFRSLTSRKGASVRRRTDGLRNILSLVRQTAREQSSKQNDPIARTRQELEAAGSRLEQLETEISQEVQNAVDRALS